MTSMKYVRVKNEIREIIYPYQNGDDVVYRVTNLHQIPCTPNLEAYPQADTIEELCDGFVIISEEYDEPHYVKKLIDTNALDFENNWKPYGNGKVLDQTCQKLIDAIIYGAIWTDKGLIYVAKMNDKGELCLI